jgi:hypothetical protein
MALTNESLRLQRAEVFALGMLGSLVASLLIIGLSAMIKTEQRIARRGR